MEPILDKVRGVLSAEFSGADVRLEPVQGNGRVWGFLIWPGWEGLDQIDRVGRVWDVLRSRLTPDEVRQVSAILTMTPDEYRDDDEPND
jgi:hypothetical protein